MIEFQAAEAGVAGGGQRVMKPHTRKGVEMEGARKLRTLKHVDQGRGGCKTTLRVTSGRHDGCRARNHTQRSPQKHLRRHPQELV